MKSKEKEHKEMTTGLLLRPACPSSYHFMGHDTSSGLFRPFNPSVVLAVLVLGALEYSCAHWIIDLSIAASIRIVHGTTYRHPCNDNFIC